MVDVNIGALRNRITLQKNVRTQNENGFEVDGIENITTVWAKVQNLHGKEYFEAKAVQEENTVKFTIRYQEGIDQSMQILFQGKAYEITAIDNIKYQNRYIEILGVEVELSG